MSKVVNHSLLTEYDVSLFQSGKHFRIYKKLGSHLLEVDGAQGTHFAVWAPNAQRVGVMGDFNGWNRTSHQLAPRWDGSGIWEGFIPDVGKGKLYKYAITSYDGRELAKGDPYAMFWEIPPNTSSITWETDYTWKDKAWMKNRKVRNSLNAPMSVYEVHMGSWKKKHGGSVSLSYTELANELVNYVADMGFTHVEFMPVAEHPYYPSWGYQITGYFAPTSRYGKPEEFMYLVDQFHQAGIGVILDWVPSHFPTDAHGLADFDGTHLYDHADPRLGFHPDWKSAIYNYGRNEVRSFLISNALYWLDRFHIDGLRVDAVASMLYLDYSREEGQWIPNMYGGNENLEAISFLREFNETVYKEYPDTITIAEESTAFSGVSRPVYNGGLGFGQKWMMGWMHDTLKYFAEDPINRKYHHNTITFSMVYAFSENFMLPLSHDEVVHGKASMINKMPGNEWQRFANLRLLYGYMFTHPGTQLLFMGGEIAQSSEWNHATGLQWELLQYDYHQGVQDWIRDLNDYYRNTPALYEKQFAPDGFEWIAIHEWQQSVIGYLRKGNEGTKPQLVICNLTPVHREAYQLTVPSAGVWREVINSDDKKYQGSGIINADEISTIEEELDEIPYYRLRVDLPPLAMIALEYVKPKKTSRRRKKVTTSKTKEKGS